MSASRQLLVAGGGICGMAVAYAAARAGWVVRVYERAPAFAEVGAGLQLAPNATRILRDWGLERGLCAVASFPDRIQVRDAVSSAELGQLRLRGRAVERYGAPYVTLHRADLHDLFCRSAQQLAGEVRVNLGHTVLDVYERDGAVGIHTDGISEVEGDALVGADGLLSSVRERMLADGPPRVDGDVAYRALLRSADLPTALRANQVTIWLGRGLHVVQYPIRGGMDMNVVAIVGGTATRDAEDGRNGAADATELGRAVRGVCVPLHDLIDAADRASRNSPPWRRWMLADRPPVQGAGQMARGLVALAGDAAHPMRPYLAQGAGMAIEDAAQLAQALAMEAVDTATCLQRYALVRWQRCARVQLRSQRNGRIFHARGLVRVGRDTSIRLLGERLLDVPWLYGAG